VCDGSRMTGEGKHVPYQDPVDFYSHRLASVDFHVGSQHVSYLS
jgi:hypothetical protein